ncbi:MAG: glycoside hydrolase family 38 C-terminal domain-containing protein, partial [Bacteroidota bacterium]
DKERRLELLAGPGAQLLVMEDPYDTWGHGLIHLRQLAGVFGEPAVVLAENGAVRATLAVTVRYRDSWARQEITLYRDLPSITGRLTVNWQERHKTLKLAFPFAIADPTATFSAPYGHATVPAAGAEEPLQEWLDLTGRIDDARGVPHHYGVALLNDGKYGGDVLGGEARLTVLRSPVYAHHDPAPLDPGLVYIHQDQGQQRLRWALVPHAGSWQEAGICHAAAAFNAPLLFVREYAHPGELPREHGFLKVDPPGAAQPPPRKKTEDGDDLILRLFEPHGREASVRISLPAAGVSFTAALGPHQIKTFRLSRDGRTREVNFLEEEPSAR